MKTKKFKATITIEKEVEIEINTDIINEEFMKHFSSYMWHVDELEEIAHHVAWNVATRDGYFIEGIGEYPKSWEREKNLTTQGVHIQYNDLNDDVDIELEEK